MSYSRTVEALKQYKKDKAELDAMPFNTPEECHKWLGTRRRAIARVQDAFYEDTKDRNSWGACHATTVEQIEQLVKKGAKK